MTPEKAALLYLGATEAAFWRWTERGQVLAWRDGPTIAFRPEVEAVLQRLARTGFPRFGVVALGLALCRQEAFDVEELSAVQAWPPVALQDFRKAAEILRRIPVSLRTATPHKAALIEALVEPVLIHSSPEQSRLVLDGWRTLPPDDVVSERPEADQWVNVSQATWQLRTALEAFDVDNWETRLRTSLESIPSAAPVELPVSQQVRALLVDLRDDRELSGVAALALKLLAAVSVPRPVSSHDDLPVGGLSDLSNRGPLDRLLLSELAHDDLTLAVRVALNEALYLRRESPPKNPPSVRCLLLDTGLRMWGLPRLFGVAVAIALAATLDRAATLRAFVTRDERIEPVDLVTRPGLLKVLEGLSHTIHPGEALQAFVEELETDESATEPILITSDDVFDDYDFRSALAASGRSLLVATVSRSGEYTLWAATQRERRVLNRATLDLELLYQRPQTLRVNTDAAGLPLVLSLPQFPLRLSHARPKTEQLRYIAGTGVLAVTSDGRLMLWDRAGWGARQLHERIAGRSPLLISQRGREAAVWIGATVNHPVRIQTVDFLTGEQLQHELPPLDPQPTAAVEALGFTLLLSTGRVRAVSDRGDVLADQELPSGAKWVWGRFFWRGVADWMAAAFDGRVVTFTPVPMPALGNFRGTLIGMVERDDLPGPIGITSTGGLQFTQTGRVIPPKHPVTQPLAIKGVSHDGLRVWLSQADKRGPGLLLSTTDGSLFAPSGDEWRYLEPDGARLMQERSLRTHFQGVFVDAAGRLSLVARRGKALAIALDAAQQRIVLQPTQLPAAASPGAAALAPAPSPSGARYSLQLAQGSDGNRVYCDSRGLVHLCPEDPSGVQVCLALPNEGALAGWSSNGQLHGTAYYLGDQRSVQATEIYAHIDRFAERW